MKPINKFRSTKSFCITSIDAEQIGELYQHYGRKLNSVAHDPKIHAINEYTVRLTDRTGICDELVKITNRVEVIEREIIWENRAA